MKSYRLILSLLKYKCKNANGNNEAYNKNHKELMLSMSNAKTSNLEKAQNIATKNTIELCILEISDNKKKHL